MDAPKCKICGERHWGLCANIQRDFKRSVAERVTKLRPLVTKPVTKPGGRPAIGDKPMSSAERVRRHRAQAKTASGN